jgi:cytidyltransferase-like protein
MVHGRFQPFHNGHLEYLLAAARHCERLLVGITNPDPARTRPEAADPKRHLPESNPFTYTERLLMVEGSVAESEVDVPVHVIPFPINSPELWPSYVPAGAVHLLRVFSDWGAAKAARLREQGFEVAVLDEGAAKEVSGEDVRRALRSGGPWEQLVPPAVARLIRSLPVQRARDLGLAL